MTVQRNGHYRHSEDITSLLSQYFCDGVPIFDTVTNTVPKGKWKRLSVQDGGTRFRKENGVTGFVFLGCSSQMSRGVYVWKVKVGQPSKNNQEFALLSSAAFAKAKEGTRKWIYRMSPADGEALCMADTGELFAVSKKARIVHNNGKRALRSGDVVAIRLDC